MPQFSIDSKDFKSILKTFSKFSAQSLRKNATSTTFDIGQDGLRMVMNTDHAFVSSSPAVTSLDGSGTYTFKPDTLLGMTLAKGAVRIEWSDQSSPLSLKNGRLKTLLKVAVHGKQEYSKVPDFVESVSVPLGILEDINKYLDIPFVFYKFKKELMPVRLFQSESGTLSAAADDGYSLARIDTNIPVGPLNVKVPKYILDCLFSKSNSPDKSVKVKVKDLKIALNNGDMWVLTAGMTDPVSDVEETLAGISDWRASFSFSPSSLSGIIKPLVSLLPAKDKSGAIIVLTVKNGVVSLSLNHSTIGEAKVDEVEGISDIYIENSAEQASANMHPPAFLEYTGLLDFESAKMSLSSTAVLYEASEVKTFGTVKVRYLFPTVLL